jgi:hypothetical protein
MNLQILPASVSYKFACHLLTNKGCYLMFETYIAIDILMIFLFNVII